jgi:type II secretory pathway component GspD/PulD (secretin)
LSNFAGVVDGISPQALAGFVNFLTSHGKCRVETTTDITVMNGAVSVVSNEVSVPIPATVSNEVGGKLRTEVTPVEGTKVTIKGCLFQNGQRLDVEATCTSIVGESRNGFPIMSTSHLSTAAGFGLGKTIVLSGLTREKEEEVVHGPAWDALRLLSKKVKVRSKSQLYICITADIGKTDIGSQ